MPKTVGKSGPHPVDIHVGRQITDLRRSRGINQSQLANALGLSFQQVQKYEKGTNRISASKLWQTAAFFGVDITEFFSGLPGGESPATPSTEERPPTAQTRAIVSLAPRLTVSQQRLAVELMRDMAENPSSSR